MSSTFRALIILILLTSCSLSGNYTKAPKSLNNACSILDQRRSFLPAFKAAKRKYGIPISVQMAVIWQESKFKSKAKTPKTYFLWVVPTGRQSSAYGYAQVLDATWQEYKSTAGRWGARRSNIRDAADFMGWYMAQNNKKLGISMWDAGNQYLAYHEGRNGYRRGSHKSKRWLLNIARNLDKRAAMYKDQLIRCGKG
ncbi:MAG: transglycosylase SLT domain-containing protein [Planktomarina sp.]|nr:transglycosylase SLT domain-containing protein [Planktomarina sp.]